MCYVICDTAARVIDGQELNVDTGSKCRIWDLYAINAQNFQHQHQFLALRLRLHFQNIYSTTEEAPVELLGEYNEFHDKSKLPVMMP